MKSTIPRHNCPWCYSALDVAVGANPPKSGDFSMCMYCRGIGRFNAELKLERPSKEQIQEVIRLLTRFLGKDNGKIH